jgi:hypothetical protein
MDRPDNDFFNRLADWAKFAELSPHAGRATARPRGTSGR